MDFSSKPTYWKKLHPQIKVRLEKKNPEFESQLTVRSSSNCDTLDGWLLILKSYRNLANWKDPFGIHFSTESSTEQEFVNSLLTWSLQEKLGELLVSLSYYPANNTLTLGVIKVNCDQQTSSWHLICSRPRTWNPRISMGCPTPMWRSGWCSERSELRRRKLQSINVISTRPLTRFSLITWSVFLL